MERPTDAKSDARAGAVPVIRVQLLGSFQIWINGQPIPEQAWRQRRAAEVVKRLAIEPSYRLHREQLIDQIWPDLDYQSGLNNLRQAIHQARRQFQIAGIPTGSVLKRDGDIVVLADISDIEVDVHVYEQAASKALRSPSPEAISAALSLYSGDLLTDDLYKPWTEPRRTALKDSYLLLLNRLGELYAQRGEPGPAIGAYQRLIELERTRESAYRALIRLYGEAGQPEAALAQYERLTAILADELGEKPEAETHELAAAIARGEIPGTGRSWRPVRTTAAVSALPAPVSSMIGRVREIADVIEMLTTSRLVTLTGPGGIGKTRLAIEVATRMAGTFNAVAFIDLSPISEPGLVLPTVAGELNIREVNEQALVSTISATLCESSLLLVLDNFEQVLDASRHVASLLEQAPTLHVLVTSRVRLNLRGELEYPVPPLPVTSDTGETLHADAITLFIERSRAVRPAIESTMENAEAIRAICSRLAGMPLAIELAAVRSRILSPPAILDRLERPLALLTSGPSDLPARQQTIRATIQWSVDLLDPEHRDVFIRLSVFAGGWTLDAAEMVAVEPGSSVDILDCLESLTASNLIARHPVPGGDARFNMLETIREFGLEQLAASADRKAVHNRHAAWVVQLIEQAERYIEGSDQAAWLKRLDQENDNIRSALAWLRERGNAEPALHMVRVLRLHWFARGHISEGLDHIQKTVSLPESAAYPALRADALITASFLAREAGDYQQAYEATRASLAISHQLGDRKRAADALVNLGFVALQQGQLDDARSLLQRSLTTNHELGNDQGIADTLGFLALVDQQRGDLDRAAQRLEQSLTIWSELDDLQGMAWAHGQLGLVRLDQGASRDAWNSLMASLRISTSLDFRGDVYLVIDGLARLAAAHGQSILAARLTATGTSIREQSDIRLSAVDQARVDRFLDTLHEEVDRETIDGIWSQRHDWDMTTLVHLIEETLEPLLPHETITPT